MENKEKVLVAMSGGVDSAASAILLLRGSYEPIGVTMSLCGNAPGNEMRDAALLCQRLGIEHMSVDYSTEFHRCVIAPFVRAYEEGETPNPCILCNRTMKFGALLSLADTLGCARLATGHYARVVYDAESGKYLLMRAANAKKDQTYVLYFLTQQILSRLLFPLGEIGSKDEVRALVGTLTGEQARKKESQDICFIPDGDYAAFIEGYTKKAYARGDFVDTSGKRLGEHRGLIHYTVGQRKGLGLALGTPMYVKEKSPEEGTVTLATNEELYSDECRVCEVNFISGTIPCEPLRCTVKTRYSAHEVASLVYPPDKDGICRIVFDSPVRAITKGQAAVFYQGDVVLGGGRII